GILLVRHRTGGRLQPNLLHCKGGAMDSNRLVVVEPPFARVPTILRGYGLQQNLSMLAVMAVKQLEVGIVVRDLEATTSFYRDGLGLPHVADLPLPLGLQRRFACGDGIVKLIQLKEQPTT